MAKPQRRYWLPWPSAIGLFFLYLLWSSSVLISAALPSTPAGLGELQIGQHELLSNPTSAASHFQQASHYFEISFQHLQQAPFLSKILTALPPFRWQVQLLKSTDTLAQTGTLVGQLATSFPKLSLQESKNPSLLLSQASGEYQQWEQAHHPDIIQLQVLLDQANAQLSSLPAWAMPGETKQVQQLQQKVAEASQGLRMARNYSDALQKSFGSQDTAPHTFLLVFQNNAELRPSGGFMGSYALLTTSGGVIRSFQFGTNIYKIDRYFQDQNIPPRFEPVKAITTYAGFRDSNLGQGFLPQIASQVAATYQEATQTPIDGVVFLDTSIVEDLLRLTGPVPLLGNSTLISADTFRSILTQEIEKNYFTTSSAQTQNEPKQVLSELIPVLTGQLTKTPGAFPKILPLMEAAVQRKSLQMWVRNSDLSTLLTAHQPLDQPVPGNWLKVVNSNIGGFKSSLSVSQTVQVEQKRDFFHQRILQKITITRHHAGSNQWPDGDNRNFMEIYLPAEAEIINLPDPVGADFNLKKDLEQSLVPPAKHWDTQVQSTKEWKKVTLWATTKARETTYYTLSYALPLHIATWQQFTYLKQAGSTQERLQALNYNGPVDHNLVLSH